MRASFCPGHWVLFLVMIGKIFKLCQLYVVNDYQTYMYLPFFISIKRYLQVPDISKDMLYFAGCGQHLPVNAKV